MVYRSYSMVDLSTAMLNNQRVDIIRYHVRYISVKLHGSTSNISGDFHGDYTRLYTINYHHH
jgi:hypothetical protein